MKAALIHLASMACWRRARNAGVIARAFIIMQTISACDSDKGMKNISIAREACFKWDTTRQYLAKLQAKGFVASLHQPRKTKHGRPRKFYTLTETGRELMTPRPPQAEPQPQPQEAPK